ncbi:hypothetical protein LSH36_321g05000 [Paralvinella palmiformis]|uniref:Uncharacterized protein n=1 Tax=Paralvinella palmiformis TaxID=53620 RepID=A0AAD9N257_9ANNE|nr:hypothetical protein LSH36_321g05000 [Paralvinella palmiformis]
MFCLVSFPNHSLTGYVDLDGGNSEGPRLSKSRVVLLNISFFGFNAMYLVLCVEVLMFITGPLVGMKSDRIVSKYGKRRPIMLASTLLL